MSGLWGLFGGDRQRTDQCGCIENKGKSELGLKEEELFCTLSRKMVVGRLSHLLGVGAIRLWFFESALLWRFLNSQAPGPVACLPASAVSVCHPEPCNSLGGDSLLLLHKAQKADTAVIMSLSVWPGAQK